MIYTSLECEFNCMLIAISLVFCRCENKLLSGVCVENDC